MTSRLSLLVIALAACSSKSEPTKETPRMPKQHRGDTISACTPSSPGTAGSSDPGCHTDADCKDGKNGRCNRAGNPHAGYRNQCGYDSCLADTDCANGGTCQCTGGGDFCKTLASAINTSAANQTGTTPAEIKKSYQADEANAIKALSKAPSEIKADVQVLVATTAQLDAALAKVNYDFTKITPADEAALDSPAFTAAESKLEAYVKAHCGFDIGAGASASS